MLPGISRNEFLINYTSREEVLLKRITTSNLASILSRITSSILILLNQKYRNGYEQLLFRADAIILMV